MFEISKLALVDTTLLHLQGPDGSYLYADEAEKEPVQIEVYGRSSKQMRNYLITAEKKKTKRAKGKKDYQPTPEEAQEDNAEFFAAITKATYNLSLDGKALTTQDDFKKLYLRPDLYFVVDAVSASLGDMELFIQR